MAPESVPWLLAGGVFLASTLQSASGIGFGGVVGPLIMISMRSSAAAQVSIVLSFVIALALAPAMLRRVDMPLLKQLVLGALIGVQLGNAAFAALSLPALEWAAAAITAFNIATIPRWTRWRSSRSPAAQQRLVGAIPGALSSALAMPGPAVAAHLDATDRDKNAIRSATVALFLWSYPIEYAAQACWPNLLVKRSSSAPPCCRRSCSGCPSVPGLRATSRSASSRAWASWSWPPQAPPWSSVLCAPFDRLRGPGLVVLGRCEHGSGLEADELRSAQRHVGRHGP